MGRLRVASQCRCGALVWLAVAAAAAVTGYTLLSRWFWPAEMLCHSRPWIGAALLACAAGAFELRCRSQAAALGVLAFIAVWPTLVLYLPRVDPAPSGSPLRVATVNLLWGTDGFDDLAHWLDEEQPLAVYLSEVDADRRDRISALREHGYPHQLIWPSREEWRPKTWGRALISRLPLDRAAVRWPGPILDARIVHEGRALRVLGAHPVRPGQPDRTRRRNEVLARLGTLAGEQGQVVVLGDLNITESTAVYTQLLETGRLRDTRAGRGRMGTWRVSLPRMGWDLCWLRLPLDHVLIGSELVTVERRLGPDFGSDHRPVLADVAWR